jgi:hypothetical protein
MNKEKGEVVIKYSGEEYKLKYTTNSLCELEDEVNLTVPEIMAYFSGEAKLGFKMLRAVLWAGLLEHHATDSVTVQMAGKMLDEITHPIVYLAVQDALIASFPEPDGSKKKTTKATK